MTNYILAQTKTDRFFFDHCIAIFMYLNFLMTQTLPKHKKIVCRQIWKVATFLTQTQDKIILEIPELE